MLYGLVLHPPLDHITGDAGGYVQRAVRLAHGGTLPRGDFFMPPGTQMLMSLPMRVLGTGRAGLWGASVLWCGLSCCYPWLAWKWAQSLSPRVAAYTAVGCAVSPLAIIYGGYFGSELPAIVLLPAALWLVQLAVRHRAPLRHALLAGVAVALLVVVRPQFLLNVAVAAAPLLPALRRRAARPLAVAALGLAGAAAAAVVLAVLAAPPHRVAGGQPPLYGQNGGLNFFYGHCDARFISTADFTFESPVRAQTKTGHDIALPHRRANDQAYFYRQGWTCIRRDPGRAVVLAARSVLDMTATSIPFPPWTEQGTMLVLAEVTNTAFCLLLALLVVVAVRRLRQDPGPAVPLAHLGCAVVVAVAFLGEPRYRVPYDLFGWALLGWWLAKRPAAAKKGGLTQ